MIFSKKYLLCSEMNIMHFGFLAQRDPTRIETKTHQGQISGFGESLFLYKTVTSIKIPTNAILIILTT